MSLRVLASALICLGVTLANSPTASADPGIPLSALVDDATQRLLVADSVAAAKWGTDHPITDPVRAQQVIDAVTALAHADAVDPGYVQRTFRDQIDAAEGVEYARFAQWRFNPAAAPTTRPDLAAIRETIDRLNHAIVDRMAADMPVLHSPTCPVLLAAARAQAAVHYQLTPLYLQALTRATNEFCVS